MADQQNVVAARPAAQSDAGSYVDWGAIVAGAVIAAAITFILMTFGAGLGLTISEAFEGSGMSLTIYIIAIGLWLVWVQVTSVMSGAYLTGRLRRRINDATEDEVSVRDGAHGLIVWALATIIGAWLTASAVGTAVTTGASVAKSSMSTIVSGAVKGSAAVPANPAEIAKNAESYALDVLFRPGAVTSGNASSTNSPNPGRQVVSDQARNEVVRLLAAAGATGSISDADKNYIAQVVTRETGVSEEQAKQRVETFVKTRNEIVAAAKAAADRAREMGIILAFVTAVSLLLAAAGGWWAATMGGSHRDEEIAIPLLIWRR